MCERVLGRAELRDAEVEQLRERATVFVAREEDVLGLEVAVGDALGVRRVERAGDRAQDRQRVGQRDRATGQQLVERLAVEKLHHVVLAAVRELAEREDVDDVAVADLVDRASLGHESRNDRGVRGEPAREHLDRDALADQRLHRPVHRAEATPADRLLGHVLSDLGPGREVLVGWRIARCREVVRRCRRV